MKNLLAAVCCVFSALALTVTATGPTLTGTEQRVTTAAADQYNPAISGNLVVYADFSGVDSDIWYADLTTGESHPVAIGPGDQQLTDISGTRIVFTDWNTMDVMLFDVASGVTTNLTNAANSNALDPAIDGDLVVWTDDRGGNSEIYARDLATGEERRISDSLLVDQAPAVDGGVIVWERCQGFGCDIFAYDWDTAVTTQISDTDYAAEHNADVSGRVVVFQREYGTPLEFNVVAYCLDTGAEQMLSLPGGQQYPHISGDFVVFSDETHEVPRIGLWQLSTGAYFPVTQFAEQYLPAIDGNRIVYTDTRWGQLELYAYTFEISTAPADTQAPAILGASNVTVDATSAQGAAVSFAVSATDDLDPAPSLTCSPAAGAMFPIGTTTVTCTAMDASGNGTTATFDITVKGADAQLAGLAALVESLNLKQGIENSLDAKLTAALGALDAARAGAVASACSKLGAFINEVNAQTGKAISAGDAAMLIAVADRIRAVLGCA